MEVFWAVGNPHPQSLSTTASSHQQVLTHQSTHLTKTRSRTAPLQLQRPTNFPSSYPTMSRMSLEGASDRPHHHISVVARHPTCQLTIRRLPQMPRLSYYSKRSKSSKRVVECLHRTRVSDSTGVSSIVRPLWAMEAARSALVSLRRAKLIHKDNLGQ